MHPWFGEWRLRLENDVRYRLRHWAESLFLGATWLALMFLLRLALGSGSFNGERAGAMIQALTIGGWLTTAILTALLALGVRFASVKVRGAMTLGCYAALPIPTAVVERGVGVIALAVGVLQGTALQGFLWLVKTHSALWEFWYADARAMGLTASVLAIAVGYLASRGEVPNLARHAAVAGHRPALLKLPWLRDAPLAALSVWQQRSGAVAFRLVLGSVPVLVALFLIPSGIDRLSAVGLIVLVLIAFWFGSVWTASIASLIAAVALLRATPLGLPRLAAAGLRYPLWILGLGASWIGIALALQSARWPLIVLVVAALAAYCALAYSLALRLRHQPARLPIRLSAESIMVLAVWQALGPFALLLLAGLVWRNYQHSKTTA